MALGTLSWLNIDFTERILRLAEDDGTVQVIDIFTKPATNKGDNYTSDMMRVSVEFTRKQGDKTVHDKKTLIFKFEPIMDGARKDMIMKTQIFDTEIAMMTDTLRKMGDILGYRLGARVFHVRLERPLCLIMEDLAPQGFRMADRQMGLDLTHCMLAIRGMAKFHAASVAICEKEPKIKSLYKKGMLNDYFPKEISFFYESACLSLADEVETWSELDKSYAERIRKLAPQLYAKGAKAVKRKDNEFSVINHGDCWVNNMLFRYDENSKPVEHIFVDFQLCFYTSPAIDLLYFLSTSLNEEVLEHSITDLQEEYLRTLTATMKQIGCKTLPPTMEELQRSLAERALYGMISSVTVLPIIIVDKNEVKDLDELFSNDGKVSSPGFKYPAYRKLMSKRLPKYAELGLFD